MRELIQSQINTIGVTIKPIALFIFMLTMLSFVTLMVIRSQCVRAGYEISTLALRLEQKNLEYEKTHAAYSNAFRHEVLIKEAVNLGYVLPKGGKVFYVQR